MLSLEIIPLTHGTQPERLTHVKFMSCVLGVYFHLQEEKTEIWYTKAYYENNLIQHLSNENKLFLYTAAIYAILS